MNFIGVTYYDKKFPNAQVHLDACLTGLGGHFDSMVYALEIPIGHNSYDICHLEMLNIVVASKIWANHWRNKKSRYIVTTWRWSKYLIQARPGIPYRPLVQEIFG